MQERGGPQFRKAGDSLRTDITTGALIGRLPSMDILAHRYNVSRVTMRNAMKYLEAEGLLSIRQGMSTYVVPKEPKESGAGNFANELPDTFNEAVRHYLQFLTNSQIPREVKVRMIGIIDSQIGLVESLKQPTINPK